MYTYTIYTIIKLLWNLWTHLAVTNKIVTHSYVYIHLPVITHQHRACAVDVISTHTACLPVLSAMLSVNLSWRWESAVQLYVCSNRFFKGCELHFYRFPTEKKSMGFFCSNRFFKGCELHFYRFPTEKKSMGFFCKQEKLEAYKVHTDLQCSFCWGIKEWWSCATCLYTYFIPTCRESHKKKGRVPVS